MTSKEKIVTGLRLNKNLNKQIAETAEYLGTTKNALITQILWEWVGKQKGKSEDAGGAR